jgi:phage gp36-like protein
MMALVFEGVPETADMQHLGIALDDTTCKIDTILGTHYQRDVSCHLPQDFEEQLCRIGGNGIRPVTRRPE